MLLLFCSIDVGTLFAFLSPKQYLFEYYVSYI